ncbi:signal-regulatory protein beta-2-like [Ixodes scapularis]|uniref:signal-regulatory protein beta-2-like n=1 Tax=Ixodes scapularis TaxID=6945 RepID=UPI001A9E486D|nr:signal-regulatory protein beta-2-like [Ixodes scapularis]
MARIYLAELLLHLLLLTGTLMTATSLKLLDVQIPRTVEEGEAVRLSCAHDLEGELPYSTTWTKNGVEFYQHTQSGGKFFQLSGADLNLQQSSATSVQLENVTKEFEGKYGCEVVTAAPYFHVVRGSGPISVVEKGDATSTGDVQLLGLDVPAYAVSGGSARLRCRFRLGDSPLYSVKWYKGTREFFRYVPSENPPKKYFILSGIRVNVTESDESSVLLEHLALHNGGTYQCEVSTDAPSFKVVAGEGILNVTDLPKKGPYIRDARTHYNIGDTVDIDCVSPWSKPAVNFNWYLNALPAEPPDFEIRNLSISHHGVLKSVSRLRLKVSEDQFINGTLSTKCVAKIPNVYMGSDEKVVHQRSDGADATTPTKSADDECLSKLISVFRKVWASYQ